MLAKSVSIREIEAGYARRHRHRGIAIRIESRRLYANVGAMHRIAVGAPNPNCEVSLACVGAHKTRGERMTCLDESFKLRATVQLAPQDNG